MTHVSSHSVASALKSNQIEPGGADRLETLHHAIEHVAHLLPAQGPITVFVHHNTLHAFEDLPFHEGVLKGARIFGCQPYLSEDRYRQELGRGRIRSADLLAVLRDEPDGAKDEQILGHGTTHLGMRNDLRMAMLQYPLLQAPGEELRWYILETNALRRYRADVPAPIKARFLEKTRHWVMRDVRGSKSKAPKGRQSIAQGLRPGESWEAFSLQALWRCCQDGVRNNRPLENEPRETADSNHSLATVERHRDLLLDATGEDIDLLVNEVLIRFCAAYLDQGFSDWHWPRRAEGFYQAFCALYLLPLGPPDRWLHGLQHELRRLRTAGLGPIESIQESLDLLGVPEAEWQDYLTATLLALRGWAGMIRQMEIRADRVAYPAPPGSLVGFLAIRLMLKRLALAHVARETLDYRGPLKQLRQILRDKAIRKETRATRRFDQRAFLLFQLAQILGWTPDVLQLLSPSEWTTLVREIESFGSLQRRRVFHEAYERRYRNQALDALSKHAQRPVARVNQPRFQTVCCIDEREESFQRHLEEVAPDVETFSMAGFFAVAMYYRGVADAHFIPQCPIGVRPQHWVVENVAYSLEEQARLRARARRALGTASHHLHVGSRTFAAGAILSTVLGLLASIPLVMRVLFPRLTAQVRRMFGRLVQPPPVTQLQLKREDLDPVGFTVAEMGVIAERVLRDLGLTSGFARLVLIIGHGSTSLNNPHNSAYNCGACAGSAGGPNARALAQILNDPLVRDILLTRGISIPEETVFLGSCHNSCNDSFLYFDLDQLPRSHRDEFEQVRHDLDRACDRNAHERCRRFQSAPIDQSFTAARIHVEERAEDLSQTRPECGHATNALCIVGRRSRTRGLYLDRRAFLNAYDPTQDDADYSILTRILAAAVPVCAGINLEYYFSNVDNPGWGCGTKLPHNVASLLGVMNGAASDLRTGLPWQMVEIHEPVRLLFIIENTPEALLHIMERNPPISQLIRNGWVQLATLDPHSARFHLFRNGRFEVYQPETNDLPAVDSSVDWYRGRRDNLGFAVIRSCLPQG